MQKKVQVILYSVVLSLAALLNSCGNSQQLEQFLSADPNLQPKTDKAATNNSSEAIAAEKGNIQLTKLPKDTATNNSELQTSENSQTESNQGVDVANLPENLPFYPQASLELITPESTPETGVSKWQSQDTIETIVSYYQQKWQNSAWEIIQPFQPEENNQLTAQLTAIVSRDDMDYTISLSSDEATATNSPTTELTISYQPNSYQANDSSNLANLANTDEQNTINTENLDENNSNQTSNISSSNSFSDLAESPEQLRQYLTDLSQLGILTPKTKDTATNSQLFKPNEAITRREYAKWLVAANNQYYANSPGNKISLANKSSKAAFKDIGVNDPDFAEIQGLAEAGLIPSPLTNDSSNLLFKPDAPLTREDLIAWKVPLDIRQGLPNADATAIKEAWGFQDASSINTKALQALFADYQNSDLSNIKRVFGYTTLFQPKKAVTRAEAAASLWYFGYQGEGVTAKDALDLAQ